MKPCIKNKFLDSTHSELYHGLHFEGAKSKIGLILRSKKGLIKSYFQSPKKRGHPVVTTVPGTALQRSPVFLVLAGLRDRVLNTPPAVC